MQGTMENRKLSAGSYVKETVDGREKTVYYNYNVKNNVEKICFYNVCPAVFRHRVRAY